VPDDVPLSYAKAVGDRLRALRRQQGLSLLAVEEASGREFKASVLGAYERGERIISVLRLQRLAHLYRVPVDQILPRPSHPDGSGGATYSGDNHPRERLNVKIDLSRLGEVDGPEREIIRRYVRTIQNQRGEFQSRFMSIRDEDLRALGRIFERDEAAMESRLRDLGLSY
jgi:transcriptional regulator with XRE-family HTH domain